MHTDTPDLQNQSILHRSMKRCVGSPGDHLHATVHWWEGENGHLLVATFAGRTRVERLKRQPTKAAVACIADDVSNQTEEYAEV